MPDRTQSVGYPVVGPFQERKWPFQWIAYCTDPECKVGIRCNSETDAEEFMEKECHLYQRR